MSAANLVARLAQAGIDPELLSEVAEALFTGEIESKALAGRRRNERERKAKSREVTGQSVTGADTPASTPPNENILTPPCEEKPETKVSVKKSKFPAPNGVGDEQWQAFRKQRKKPLSDHSYTLLCNKLARFAEAGWPPGEMIDLAVERGWETVFEPRNFDGQQRTNGLAGNKPNDGLSATTRAARDVFGIAASH